MRFSLILLALCAACAAVSTSAAEEQDAPQRDPGSVSSSSASAGKKEYPPVRRFSAGGYFSYSGLQLTNKGTSAQSSVKGNVTTTINDTTVPRGGRLGGGVVVQFAVSDRYAVAAMGIIREQHFNTTSVTTLSTNKSSNTVAANSADLLEIPILARRYSKSRREQGARWFIEAGPSLRWTHNVRTSVQSTDTTGVVSCCTENPLPVQHRISTGFAVGAGYQLVDQFGIHLVPGIRYTRWVQSNFNNLSLNSNQNQVEAGVSITF